MLKLRLTRTGTKDKAQYRIVVQEARSKRDGRYVENLGYYNPRTEPSTIVVKLDRVDYWIKNGAQPTDSVASLLKRARVTAGDTVTIPAPAMAPAAAVAAPRVAAPAAPTDNLPASPAPVASASDAVAAAPEPAADILAASAPVPAPEAPAVTTPATPAEA